MFQYFSQIYISETTPNREPNYNYHESNSNTTDQRRIKSITEEYRWNVGETSLLDLIRPKKLESDGVRSAPVFIVANSVFTYLSYFLKIKIKIVKMEKELVGRLGS